MVGTSRTVIVVVEPDAGRWAQKRRALRERGFEPMLARCAASGASIVDAFDVRLVLVSTRGARYGRERLVVQLRAPPSTCVLVEVEDGASTSEYQGL